MRALMKLVPAVVAFSSLLVIQARAQLTPEEKLRYEKHVEKLQGRYFAQEVIEKSLDASYFCGRDVVTSVSKQIKENKLPVLEGQSKECLNFLDMFVIVSSEAIARPFKPVETKEYFKMQIELPETLPASAEFYSRGSGACVEATEKMMKSWTSTKKLMWSPNALGVKSYTAECQIEKGYSDVADLLCTNQWVRGTYTFKIEDGALATTDFKMLSPAEQKRQQEIIDSKLPVAEKQKLLKESLSLGFRLLSVLRFNQKDQTGTLSFVGINGKTWIEGIYEKRRKSIDLEWDCSSTVSFPLKSTPPVPGKIF